ncbi:replicative DNA helicase [Paenibacillus sophorae]|uniref:DnaB-like helicase C-terminal domain-containing protein n=1 Tax=Paenibacillus sophorae TaxID=1333845 RepID=A0A1H8VT82_9BACL|nr:DnaB-like helicase C-terminal domain-containing protein [Paenibacillus sophorae]QWU15699.1 DnaB-like helicase C-terminal domain-containing protein [Paenibacillus sophorae]SEP18639.1 replicative DNA helicase [Paenibacillus sophorae]
MTDFTGRAAEPHEEVLGALLKDPSLYPGYKHGLTPEHFKELDWLYRIIQETDAAEELSFRGIASRIPVDRIKLLHDLRGTFISESRLPSLIQQLKKDVLAEELKSLSLETLGKVNDENNPDDVLRVLQQRSLSLFTSESKDGSTPDKDVDGWVDYILEIVEDPKKAFGLLSGMYSIDKMTTGWHRQDFSVIGARTSMGKTAFVLEMLMRLNAKGHKCAMFSLEMAKRQLFNRMMANILQVDFEQFRTGQLPKHFYTEHMVREKKRLTSLYIDDTRAVSADYIVDEMRRLKRTQGLDFVVVDYLQDVREQGESNDNGGSALARVCRKLRAGAQEMDCHVMGLSQVVRGVEDRKDKRPGNADLAGSTGIETSADVIALLYRDDYYEPTSSSKGILEVNFTKQRNGSRGKVELMYDRQTQRITELEYRR